jgi:hypothetical protein
MNGDLPTLKSYLLEIKKALVSASQMLELITFSTRSRAGVHPNILLP